MDAAAKKRQLEKAEEYFNKKNIEALKRYRARLEENKPRLSPVTGEPMVQESIMGIVVDRCPTTKGIWLDAGELEEILDAVKNTLMEEEDSMLTKFFSSVFKGEEKKD